MLDWMILGDVLRTSLRLMVPIAFAALGGVICERSGVYNVGIEGMMLSGAFGAALGTFLTGSPVAGVMVGLTGMGGAAAPLTPEQSASSLRQTLNRILCLHER